MKSHDLRSRVSITTAALTLSGGDLGAVCNF